MYRTQCPICRNALSVDVPGYTPYLKSTGYVSRLEEIYLASLVLRAKFEDISDPAWRNLNLAIERLQERYDI